LKRIAIADVSEYRLSLAKTMGADLVFNPSMRDEREQAFAAIEGGPELVVLATGSSAAFEDGMRVVAKGGTVLMFGVPPKDSTATLGLDRIFLKGTTLITSYASTEKETAAALEMLADKRIDVSDMITHRFPLEKAADAFAVASQQQCMKALVTN